MNASATNDIVVVGGGPVGLATALYAGQSGLSVVVLEPRPGAVDKACGEGLMPGGVRALGGLGVRPTGQPLEGISYLAGHRRAQANFSTGLGLGVRRTELHRALREEVAAQGIDVLPLAARAIAQEDGTVQLQTSGAAQSAGPVVTGRYVLAADGLHSWTRRTLGLDVPARRPQRYGQRRHYGIRPWSNHVEVHWGRHCEAYVTPVGPELVGVAILTARRAPFEDQLAEFPELQTRLGKASAVTAAKGAGPLRQRSSRRVAGRVLLVGDAGGYVDALTGEGISLGLAQAQAAVAAVAAGRPGDYERGWRQASWRYAVLTHALVQTTRPPWARRAIVPAAAAAPAVFRAAVNQLGRSR